MKYLNLFLLLLLGLHILSCSSNQKKPPQAKNGVLDLRGWDFENDGNVRLDGEWEFYWKQFLKSKDFDTVKTHHYIKVPKPWNDYKWGNEELGFEGYSTYQLKILVNNKIKDFGLKFPDQGTAFELYLNDSLVGKNGKIGKTRETSEPQYKPLLIPFKNLRDTIEIVCRISNYDFHFGGLYFLPDIGTESKIRYLREKEYLSDYIISSTLFILFLILILFFMLMPQDIMSLLFSIYAFISIFRTITVNERVINELLPFLSWEWCIKIEAISWMSMIPLIYYCFESLLNYKILKYVTKILTFYYLLIIIITLITPSGYNSQLIFPSQIVAGIVFIFAIIINSIAILQNKESAKVLFIGILIFFFAASNELLYYNNVIPLYINYPTGADIFIFSWVIILAKRFQRNYRKVENFAKELRTEVEIKTKDLRNEKEKTEILLKKSEQLLLNVLPEPIAIRLKEGETQIADHFEEASVVFIDIADFTKLSAKSTPQKMVKLLNEIFTIFDKIAAKYRIEKIKTIGDCYMAAAGIPVPRTDHAELAAKFALDSLESMKDYRSEDEVEIQFRIGLDCGPIVAGVIGEQKFIYDLWGDMVNTASRMETSGVIGKIQCTERFKEKISNNEFRIMNFEFEDRGEIEIKGKGMMKTWFLEK